MKKSAVAPNETIIAYKGFKPGLICHPGEKPPFQYEVGKTYEMADEEVAVCNSGFHAVEYPLDVFQYYPPAESEYAVVEQSGTLQRHHIDSKIASSRISIKEKIDLAGIVKAAVEYTISRAKPEGPMATSSNGLATASGYQGAAIAPGTGGAATASGVECIAIATGWHGRARATQGNWIIVAHRDDYNHITAIRTAQAGKDVKPDTWYVLNAKGEFEEVSE